MKKLHSISIRLSLLIMMAVSLTAAAQPRSAAEKAEYARVKGLEAECGENLLCYFTQAEIEKGLDMPVQEAEILGYVDKDFGGPVPHKEEPTLFALADMSGTAIEHNGGWDISAAKKVKKKKTAVKGKSKSSGGGSGAPVWAKFITNFRDCTDECVPGNYGTYRNDGKFSCHNSGRAVDVGAIVCNGRAHPAGSAVFASFVKCMKPKIKTLWQNKNPKKFGKTQAHYDHAHFSVGCTHPQGFRFW